MAVWGRPAEAESYVRTEWRIVSHLYIGRALVIKELTGLMSLEWRRSVIDYVHSNPDQKDSRPAPQKQATKRQQSPTNKEPKKRPTTSCPRSSLECNCQVQRFLSQPWRPFLPVLCPSSTDDFLHRQLDIQTFCQISPTIFGKWFSINYCPSLLIQFLDLIWILSLFGLTIYC